MLKASAPVWLVVLAAIVAAGIGAGGGAAIGAYVLTDSATRQNASSQDTASGWNEEAWQPESSSAWESLEGDPGRAALAIQPFLDPDPADVAFRLDELETVLLDEIESMQDELGELRDIEFSQLRDDIEEARSALASLCDELAYAAALSDLYLPC